MKPERWSRIEAICFGALELEGDERTRYVTSACGDDEALRRDVARLLDRMDADADFLETPLARVAAAEVSFGGDETRFVGGYRLVRPLGAGGMGEVHLAVRESAGFRHSVALKIIKPGMDTREVLRRFQVEREILASLRHPNVAHLLDGGATEDGRPYFVMEHVEGTRIDEYCEARGLSLEELLELFTVVCSAVQHAHNNLVVHRDIKPSNILVTPEGVPKLLDFGIGTFLAPAAPGSTRATTRPEARPLTPEYASPEQVRGEQVTTATDVYGLGVLLFKLLTGEHPYAGGKRTPAEVQRAVCEETPPRPSTVVAGSSGFGARDRSRSAGGLDAARRRRRLKGDLDNIVLKALRKEPSRRYASAAALAEDLRRHLEHRPVRARPDTVAYRTTRFVRRHAWAVAAGAVLLVALVTTSVVTAVQSQRVAEERDTAREVRGFLMEMFGATGADQAMGDSVTARQLLDLQVERLGATYAERPQLEAEMLEVLADGYDRLGLWAEAEPLARRAVLLRREHQGERHPDVAQSLTLLGWVMHQRGASADADPLLREAIAIRRAAGRRYRLELARSLNDLGVVRDRLGDYEEAELLYREALDLRLAMLGPAHRSVGITASNLAAAHYRSGDLQEAIRVAEQARATLLDVVGPDHDRMLVVEGNLATFHLAAGDTAAAEQRYREIVERSIRVRGRIDPRTAMVMSSLGRLLRDAGESSEAAELFEEVVSIREATLGPRHPEVAATLMILAELRIALADLAGAEAAAAQALAIRREALGDDARLTGSAATLLASVRWRRGDTDGAISAQRRAVASYAAAVGLEERVTRSRRYRLCLMLGEAGRHEEAVEACAEVHESYRTAREPDHQDVHWTRLLLARSHLALGHARIADSLLSVARPGLEAGDATDRERGLLEELTEALALPHR